MSEINWFNTAISFLGGFGLFLFGMDYMGEGLQKAAGSKMKNLLGVLTNKRFLGVLVGAGVTALIQSSSATTVMVVGFVNAGLMSLKQAVGVIMGANIGTTVTAWIVSLGEWTSFLKPAVMAPICIVIGVVLIMFVKNTQARHIGEILFGFGALFLGLEYMSDAAKPLRELEEVKSLFVSLGGNPFLGILTGALVTAIIQSSSASVGILQALAAASLVPWSSAIYIILGQNIGTCVTAMLSAIGASQNAKRAAVIHLLFNFIGAVFFAIIAIVFFEFLIPERSMQLIDITQISIVHTVFNVLNTMLLYPFTGVLVRLAEIIIKNNGNDKVKLLQHLDDRILETPSFAVENAVKEVVHMGAISRDNVRTALEGLFEKSPTKIKKVFEVEKSINKLQEGISEYLVKFTNLPLSEVEQSVVTNLFYTIHDIERVGDHAENIAELAQSFIEENMRFTDEAKIELKDMTEMALRSFELAIKAYEENNKELAMQVLPLEGKVDEMEMALRDRHIKRLANHKCDANSGAIFLDTISNMERISDHAAKIAKSVISIQNN